MSSCRSAAGTAFLFTLGTVTGAAVHAVCCAGMSRRQQNHLSRRSRSMVRRAKAAVRSMHL